MIVVIDNYDSFTYNLVHYIGELNQEVKVIRNDLMTVDEVLNLSPKKLLSRQDHALQKKLEYQLN